jgi:esterase/lipase superfamily enzyme
MYTVGLIDNMSVLRTSSYEDSKKALAEFKNWKIIYLNNNSIEGSTTIVEKDSVGGIMSIKLIFRRPDYTTCTLFLCKNR